MEAFAKSPGSASILIKAAIAAGQSVLPIIMGIIMAIQGYYGWSFILCCIILGLNALIVLKMPFPNYKITPEEKEKDLQTLENQTPILKQKANFLLKVYALLLLVLHRQQHFI